MPLEGFQENLRLGESVPLDFNRRARVADCHIFMCPIGAPGVSFAVTVKVAL